jgi:hypothetical protein
MMSEDIVVVADLIVNWVEHDHCPALFAPFSLQRFGMHRGFFQ